MTKSINEIWQELSLLSRDDLLKASLERKPTKKNPKGFYTQRAKLAQQMIWEGADTPFQSSSHWKRDHMMIKKFEDILMENNSKNKVHIALAYNPIVIARELGYPPCIIDAIIKAKTEGEITKIMIDARHGKFKKYEKVQKLQSV